LPAVDVYLTVDVECSMGGAWVDAGRRPVPPDRRIFCRRGGSEWGIGFFCSELTRRGLRATFFTEMFGVNLFGENEMRPVTDLLLESGQDVQLHLHPIFLRYAELRGRQWPLPPARIGEWPDAFTCYDEEEQYRLLEQGAGIFRRLVGRPPVAFRAGGYAANRATLRALARLGVLLDSSANPAWSMSFPGEPMVPNRASRAEGVWEIPVTVARTRFPDTKPLKHLEIPAISFAEMRMALDAAQRGGLRRVVIMFHSFGAVKARDVGYERFRPDRIAISRFRRLLDFLAENSSAFRVRTFDDLAGAMGELSEQESALVPDFGWRRPLLRKVVQAANRLYWA
jgi:hypothetical protein